MSKIGKNAKTLATLAVMTALLIVGKWSLNVLANVEVVTLFCAVFGYTFGFIAIIPSTIFCFEEMLVWGAHTWVICYFLHWNLVVIAFALLGARKRKKLSRGQEGESANTKDNFSFAFDVAIPTAVAVTLTALFGVLTSAVDAVFACINSSWDKFLVYFSVIYARGIVLYIVHVVCNFVAFLTLFYPLTKLVFTIKPKIDT